MKNNIYYFKCAETEFGAHFVISIYLPFHLYEGLYQTFVPVFVPQPLYQPLKVGKEDVPIFVPTFEDLGG